jgi:hypothetical protein
MPAGAEALLLDDRKEVMVKQFLLFTAVGLWLMAACSTASTPTPTAAPTAIPESRPSAIALRESEQWQLVLVSVGIMNTVRGGLIDAIDSLQAGRVEADESARTMLAAALMMQALQESLSIPMDDPVAAWQSVARTRFEELRQVVVDLQEDRIDRSEMRARLVALPLQETFADVRQAMLDAGYTSEQIDQLLEEARQRIRGDP